MDIYLMIYLVLIVAPFSTLLHEIGHAIAARIVKAEHITLSIGLGKYLNTINLKKIEISIHTIFFLGGIARSRRNIPYKPWEIVWISISGPVTNGIFAFLFYFLYMIYPNNYFQLIFLFNVWLAVVNIVPFKLKEKQTDGYTILREITQKGNF